MDSNTDSKKEEPGRAAHFSCCDQMKKMMSCCDGTDKNPDLKAFFGKMTRFCKDARKKSSCADADKSGKKTE